MGRHFELDDPAARRLRTLARAGGTDPRPLLSETSVFGRLGQDKDFVRELEDVLEALARDGTRATVASVLAMDGLIAA